VFNSTQYILLCLLCTNVVAGELSDPTRPVGYVDMQPVSTSENSGVDEGYLPLKIGLDPSNYRLQGIIVSRLGNSAMVNGNRVRVGDQADGATVAEIEPGYIILESHGEHLKVKLLSLRVKQLVKRSGGEDK